MTEKYAELISKAREVRENAYAPYSNYKVGAALLCKDGSIYTGVNVENAAYSAGICAERAALSAAVADGKRKFLAIAIYAGPGVTPCGICRQMLSEFGDMWVISASDSEKPDSITLGKLLPASFGKNHLKQE